MRSVFILVLVAGLGLAGFAVYMAKDYIDGYENALAAERAKAGAIETRKIYIVTKPVKYGDEITPKHVMRIAWPTVSIPKGAYFSKDKLFPEASGGRRSALRTIEPGEAILKSKLTRPGETAGLTALLEKGQQAFTIRVDVTSGVSGFLRPGHHVDIYWTGRRGKRNITKLIHSSARLIAVDQSANEEVKSSGVARTVTVAGSRQDVASLTQAQTTGRLTLALVGSHNAMPEDIIEEEVVEVDQNKLLGIAPKQAPTPKEKVCTIRNRRGAQIVEIPIPCTN